MLNKIKDEKVEYVDIRHWRGSPTGQARTAQTSLGLPTKAHFPAESAWLAYRLS